MTYYCIERCLFLGNCTPLNDFAGWASLTTGLFSLMTFRVLQNSLTGDSEFSVFLVSGAESISAFISCLKAQSSMFFSSRIFCYWPWKYSEQQKTWDLLDTVKTYFWFTTTYHYLYIFVNFIFMRVMTIFYFFYNQNPHLRLLCNSQRRLSVL